MSSLKKRQFNKKNVFQNLKTVYGLSETKIKTICKHVGLDMNYSFKNLKENKITGLLDYIEKNFYTEATLKLFLQKIKEKNSKAKTYKELRHSMGLPANGQRTHTNAKTKRKLKYVKHV